MSMYENYDCWVEEADSILSSREDQPYEAEWAKTILFKKIGAKSATIRVDNRNIGSGGTGISIVNNLLKYLENKFSNAKGEINYEKVVIGMDDLFDDCDEE